MISKSTESRLFGDAMAKHLGITEHGITHVAVEGKPGALLTAVITVAISADDLASVAARMKGQEPRINPVPMPNSR